MLFLTIPSNNNGAQPVAMWSEFTPAGRYSGFEWTDNYSAYWGQTTAIPPETIIKPKGSVKLTPEKQNSVSLGFAKSQCYFYDIEHKEIGGKLQVVEDPGIPVTSQFYAGFEIDSNPIIVSPCKPNLIQALEPEFNFWIAFGNFKKWQIVDPNQIQIKYLLEFPEGAQGLKISLNQDRTWTSEPIYTTES